MLKRILSLAASLLVFAFCRAQIPSQIIFNRITKKEGLASNTVFQTVRDKQGFLWLATQNGLQRYDGNRFLTFRHIPGDSNAVVENSINHLFIDKKERLWLLFNKQAGIFNGANFRFSEIGINASINMIKKIMEDEQGRIILFADSKQFIYNESKKIFESNYPLPSLPPGYTVGDMAIDFSSGLHWFTGKQGSFFYDSKNERGKIMDPLQDSFSRVKNVKYPFIAQDGTYWVVNWIPFTAAAPSLYRYDKKNNQLQKFEKIRAYTANSYYEIWNIFQQSNGNLWIYGMGLLAYYDAIEKRFIYIHSDPFQQNGIDYDFVNSLSEDVEKNVWVSTNKGLYRFNTEAQLFRNLRNRRFEDTATIHNAVSTILQTQNNGIWVATWGAGIFSYDDIFKPVPNPVTAADPANKSLHVASMMQRRNGEIWIGLQTGELKIYEPSANKCFSVPPSFINAEVIQQIFEDHEGNTWIGSNTGSLLKCDKGNWRDSAHSFKRVLSDVSDIFKLYEDDQHHLWVCTASSGVYQIDRNDGHIIKQFKETGEKNDGLLNDGATDIVQYNDSVFLIASDGLCLLNYKKNTFSYLTAADGLPTEHITTLIVDKSKRLWVACDGGLYRLNINNKLYVSFDVSDGITNDILQVSAGAILKDGRIAIGTPNDFLVFDPEKTINKTPAPLVNITGFELGSNPLPVDSVLRLSKLVLPYNNTFLRIELSTLHFRDQFSIHYMLEGLDDTWKEAENNEIVYQYLPPGNYTLKLRSENGEGMGIQRITVLPIHIRSPFWKTWWFYSLLILCVGGLLFWLDHQRMKRKDTVLKMRSNIADGLHQDISAALGNITILSEMAKMKADTEPEKSKQFIEQINIKSQNMTVSMDDMLWSIDPENDSMDSFMQRFREYIDELKNRYAAQVDVLIDKKAMQLHLTMKMRNDVFWLFKGGITNVVKTGADDCRIHITYEKTELIYTLEFDTGSMDTKQINNLRQRKELTDKVKLLNASLDFTEHKTNAVFVLKIPVKGSGF